MPRPEASSRTGTKGARVLGHGSATFSLTVYGHLFDDDLDALAGRLDELRRASDVETPAAQPRPNRDQRQLGVARQRA